MVSTAFETLQSADWPVKGLVAGVILLISFAASEWVNQLWLEWRLRKYPVVNRGKPQAEFMKNADSFLRKGLEIVSSHLCSVFWERQSLGCWLTFIVQYKGQPFRIHDFSQVGAKLMLPLKYLDEYKSNPDLDFGSTVHKVKNPHDDGMR